MDKENSLNANTIIKKLKKSLQVNTDIQLSELLKVKPNTISTWKKRNSLDFNSIISICEDRGIDLNEIFCETSNRKKKGVSFSDTPLVRTEMLFQYCINNSGIVESLPRYSFPFLNTPQSRAFQVASNNMFPLIEENAFVVCESVEKQAIIPQSLVVAISRSRGHFIGKINADTQKPGYFTLTSENNFFSTIALSFDEVDELWLIKGTLSYNINSDTENKSQSPEEVKSI